MVNLASTFLESRWWKEAEGAGVASDGDEKESAKGGSIQKFFFDYSFSSIQPTAPSPSVTNPFSHIQQPLW